MSGDKNIVTSEAANYAASYIYVIKFLSKHNDKNLITFPTDDKNMVTLPDMISPRTRSQPTEGSITITSK